jgi:uncharacterized protein (DUF302 family)
MKKNVIIALIAFIAGIVATSFVMFQTMPKMMLVEDVSKYDFDTTHLMLEKSIIEHDWKVPAVHDLQATMEKFGMKVRPVKVFELCHPSHAGKILNADNERIVSSLMPCRVAIYEKEDGKTYISRMNSALMASMMGGLIKEVMAEAYRENEIILNAIVSE